MEKKYTAKRWITVFAAILLILCLLFSLTVYVVDPFFQFRVRDNTYKLNGIYVSPGLVKNYDYDTLIIGSSMTQNFSMDVFREELNVKPLHIGIGAMSCEEMNEYLSLAKRVGKAKKVYACVDLLNFAVESAENKNPQYLMRDDMLSLLQYFLSYEAWFRFMPVDVGFALLKNMDRLPESFAVETSIDTLEYFGHRFEFSEKAFLEKYAGEKRADRGVVTDGLYERMTAAMDVFLDGIDFGGREFIFFFPPYSGLYWCCAEEEGAFEQFTAAKKYFVKRANELGAVVYDFQAEDYVFDLENYTDINHHSPAINDLLTRCFADGSCIVHEEDCDALAAELKTKTALFRLHYPELFCNWT